MNSELLTLSLSDLETLIASKSNCNCHFINPNKTRIILWKQTQKDNPDTYYLRIGIQKFISYPLTDKNSEIYWRFNAFENSVLAKQREEVSNSTNSDSNPITKYQQRIEKTQQINHGKSNSVTNHSEQSESTSH